MSFEEIRFGVPVTGATNSTVGALEKIAANYDDPSATSMKQQILHGCLKCSGRPRAGCCRDEKDNCALVIDHHHPVVRHWETLVMVAITLNSLMIMFMAAFDSTPMILWIIVWLFDLINVIDVVLTFAKSYTDDKGMSVRDRKSITMRYLKGAFVLDFLSTLLILDWLTPLLTLAKPWKTLTVLRLNRLIRIYKVLLYFDCREEELGTNTTRLRYAKYGTISIITTHALTCMWYALACSGIHRGDVAFRECNNGSWPVALEDTIGFPMSDSSTINAYIVSLYWAVATATSTGYGDIAAVQVIERAFATAAMLTGISVFFGMMMGGITSMLTNKDTRRANYAHRTDIIKEHLIDLGVASDLIRQCLGYYDYLWIRKKGIRNEGIYAGLPLSFQAEISHTTNSGILEKAPIFHNLGEGFLRMLSLNIKHMLFLPKQIIIKRGDVGSQMFFIHRGMVEVLSEEDEETPVAALKSGKLFGEVSLIYSMPRTATIRAATHCDLMVLDKQDLNMILVHYPDISRKLQSEAKERCAKAEEILVTKEDENPHYRATRMRRHSYITPAPTRRESFIAEADVDSDVHNKQELRRASMTTNSFSINMQRGSIQVTESFEMLQTDMGAMEELHHFVARHKKSFGGMLLDRLNDIKKIIQSTTINPTAPMRHTWDSTVMGVVVIMAAIYPYLATFSAYGPQSAEFYHSTAGYALMGLTYIVDFFLLSDIIIALRTGVNTAHGYSAAFKDILKMYCKSWVFAVDVLSLLPLEIFCLLAAPGVNRWRMFTRLKLNRLIKIVKVNQHLNDREEILHSSLGLTRGIKLALYVILLSHWVACVLYCMACYGSECSSDSWIVSWSMRKGDVRPFNMTSAGTEYIISLYWAAATMTSTGYGDIRAETTHGRLIALCAMLLGLLVYGYCLAVMAATVANADMPKVRFQERLFAIMNFMRERKLSDELQSRVAKYLSYLWVKYRGEWIPGDKSLLHDMPIGLQQDIALDDAQKNIAHVPLFKDTDDAFLRSLAMRCTSYVFNPGDVIVYAGDMGKEMYCVRRGLVQIMTMNMNKVLATLGDGQYFGEIGMIFGDYRTATVVAKTHVEALMITMNDLEEVLKEFPLLEEQFAAACRNKSYLRQLQKAAMKRVSGKVIPHDDLVKEARRSLANTGTIRLRWREQLPKTASVAKFKRKDIIGDVNHDYMDPFMECGILARFFSSLLLRLSFLPTGRVLKTWTCINVVVAVLNAVTVPILVAFLYNSEIMWGFAYVLDIISFINIYICFHAAYYNDDNVIVTHPLSTARHYLRTSFVIDLLTCFPLEIFVFIGYSDFATHHVHLYALARMNRVIQLYRLPLAFNYLESSVEKETGLLREVKFAFYTGIFINFLTCAVFIVGCPPFLDGSLTTSRQELAGFYQCQHNSWIFTAAQNINTTSTTWHLYVLSFYWASATAVSVGYGDIAAYNDLEMAVSLSIMITGVLFFGYIIASVAATLANADAQRARFHEKLAGIKHFMEDHKTNEALQKRVMAHYQYVWLRTNGVDPDTLFHGLPYSLWGDVTLSLYMDIISKISLFKDTEMSFIKMLSRCIKPMLFLKGEYVVKKHDIGSEMFFIHRGSVDVTSEDGNMVFDTMRPGAAFGEVALLFSCPRTACIRARTNCDVFCLAKQDLDRVLDLYPAVKKQVMQIAEERRQQAQKRSAAKVEKKASNEADPKPSDTSTTQDTEEAQPEESAASTSDHSSASKEQYSFLSVPNSNLDVIVEGESDEDESQACDDESQASSDENPQEMERIIIDSREHSGSETSNIIINHPDFEDGDEHNDNGNNNYMENRNRNNNLNKNWNNKDGDGEEEDSTCVEVKTNCLYTVSSRLRKLNRFVVNPNKERHRTFDSIMSFTSVLICWLVMYLAIFQNHLPGLIFFSYICDCLFWIEIYVNFHLSFVDEYGDLVDEFEVVSRNYWRTLDKFLLDLISVLPLEILAFGAPAHKRMLAWSYLRLTRLIRFHHISRFFAAREKQLDVNMLAVRLTKFGQILLLTIHITSCIWYGIACPLDECQEGSWAYDLGTANRFKRYCSCIYWAVATMTSTGYGDVHAHTSLEMVCAACVMVLGKLLFGFILGTIASTLSNAEATKVAYEEKLQAITNTMMDQDVPKPLQKRVTSYYDYLWIRNKGVDIKELCCDAPVCLAAELYLEVAKPMFEAIALFQGADESFLRQLSFKVQRILYMPGDFIVKKDDVGNEVMYIYDGEAEITDNLLEDGDVLTNGDVFGEVSLIRNLPRRVSLRALKHVEIFSLSRYDLEFVLDDYPTVAASIQHIGNQRFKDILALNPDNARRLSRARQKSVVF